MEYVVIGKIVNTFGIKGELKVYSYTDFVKERFKKGSKVYLSEKYLPFEVNSCREHKGFLLVSFKDHEEGEKIGRVKIVEEGIRSNNLRIVKYADEKEYLVPFLDVFIEKVDLENKRIDIVEMEGLL